MILKTYRKQPNEAKDYDIDYAPWLTPMADTLDLVTASVECLDDPSNTSLEVTDILITPTTAKLWIAGGTSDMEYKITINATTVGGRVDESELKFLIEDV